MLRSQNFALPQLLWARSKDVSPPAQEPDHPALLLEKFCRRHSEIEKLELSVYSYRPQTIEDERRTFRINAQDLISRFQIEQSSLGHDQEIAFHSRVWVRRGWTQRLYHIPMIDFGSDINDQDINRLVELSSDFGCDKFEIFNSGRSFHFYGLTLLTQRQWTRFMGRILLLNIPGAPNFVDTRWVGHRLMAGYSSLRWTQNTAHYKQRPKFDRMWDSGTTTRKQRAKELVAA